MNKSPAGRKAPPGNPPASLSPEALTWQRLVLDEFRLDHAAGRLLLQTALEAFDSMRAAQRLVDEHGPVLADRFGQLRANPACALLRDARAQMLGALKQLNLDIEPLRDGPGRPPGAR